MKPPKFSLTDRVPLVPEAADAMASVFIKWPTLHPNIYRKRIAEIQGRPRAGDWVAVYALEERLAAHEPSESAPPPLPVPVCLRIALQRSIGDRRSIVSLVG